MKLNRKGGSTMKKVNLFVLGCGGVVGLLVFAPLCLDRAQAASPASPTPHVQQVPAPLVPLLRVLPADVRQMVMGAFRALPPDRADATLARVQALPHGQMAAVAQAMVQALQSLPPNARQPFVNGLFGVSPGEVQFAQQVVLQLYQQQLQRQPMQQLPQQIYQQPFQQQPFQQQSPQPLHRPQLLEQQLLQQQQQAEMIARSMNRMYERHNQLLEDMNTTTRRVGQGWSAVLGGKCLYGPPYHRDCP